MAGTGKTRLLDTARDIWERQGLEVRGIALAGKASKGLEEGAGIKSETIHKTLSEIKKGSLKLSEKSLIVLDEAGMVGTKMMSEIISEVKKSRAQLILVGDSRQLQPIDAGNPFFSIGQKTGQSELQEIFRQKDDWAKQAVKDFASGRSEKGLKAYLERDLLTVSKSQKEAVKSMVKDWKKEATDFKESLMLAGTKAEVKSLNREAQAERIADRELGRMPIQVNGEFIYKQDRILFTQNSRLYGVKNGELGTVSKIDNIRRTIKVKKDDGKNVTIPLKYYENIDLGYAVTTHKAQGITIDKAYILAGGFMQDRELTYVQMSRSREQTKLYVEKEEAGETIRNLSKRMSKSRMKELAQDFADNLKGLDSRNNRQEVLHSR